MSGVGQRFIDAGFKKPKPLIEIDNKPIIEHVINLFPQETKFTFICNSQHLKETKMKEIIEKITPNANIAEIPKHKLGPVFAVSQIFDQIDDNEEVIVNYCDFGTYWNYENFLTHTRKRNADGAVVSYKGFHPHMLGSTNYAFMRDHQQQMLEIKEKEPFTNNRMNEFASNGTYYFKTGALVKKYFRELIDSGKDLNGEYYVSMVYNLLVRDSLNVSIYKIQHMLQWGTPQDVEEYNKWSQYFRDILDWYPPKFQNSITLLPMAGRGQRFKEEGYKLAKPLLPVSGKPMIVQAFSSLPASSRAVFICQETHLEKSNLENVLKKLTLDSTIIPLKEVTEGQACTCEIGAKEIDDNTPLTISACDTAMVYNRKKFTELIERTDVDVIIWTFKNHPSANNKPEMYGWVKTEGENVVDVSVKKPLSENPKHDHGIVGTFTFKKSKFFKDALKELYKRNLRINNEFYVDSLFQLLPKMGINCKVFCIDHYICFGTPDEYKTFNYWQSFFHKCNWHPYTIEADPTVDRNQIEVMKKDFFTFFQEF